MTTRRSSRRGWQAGRIVLAGLALTFLLSASTGAAVLSGSYGGNNGAQSITGLGFQPDVVIVKATPAREPSSGPRR
jgi:hypothetical protein